MATLATPTIKAPAVVKIDADRFTAKHNDPRLAARERAAVDVFRRLTGR